MKNPILFELIGVHRSTIDRLIFIVSLALNVAEVLIETGYF